MRCYQNSASTLGWLTLAIASVHAVAVPLQSVWASTCYCPCCATTVPGEGTTGEDGASTASGWLHGPHGDDGVGRALGGLRANRGAMGGRVDGAECGICRCHGPWKDVSASRARGAGRVPGNGPTAPRLPPHCLPVQPVPVFHRLQTSDRLPSSLPGAERGILLCALLL